LPGLRDSVLTETVRGSVNTVRLEENQVPEVITDRPDGLSDGKPVGVAALEKSGGEENPAFRFRCIFSKKGNTRFLSHRELVDIIRRVLRRTGLPVNVSKGYHPQIKLSIAPPLSVGMEGENEFFDIELKSGADIVPSVFQGEFPSGIEIKRCVGPFSKKNGKLPAESLLHYHLDFKILRLTMKGRGNSSKCLPQSANLWYSLKDSLNLRDEESNAENWLAENPAGWLKKRWSDIFGRKEIIVNRRGKTRSSAGCQVEEISENILGLKLLANGGAGITPMDLLNIYLPEKLAVLVKISRKALYYKKGDKYFDPAELVEKR